ncbi:MAG: chorismate mutase [Acetobacteraceae bacterium]|nr:chorismate mutase [Acetobacteraceae bacterium]
MSEPVPTPETADAAPPPPSAPPGGPRSLADVRAELDRIDTTIHDLLMQRAGIVAHGITAAKTGLALRPGREAQIIRRLLARHVGPLSPHTMVRLWRELLAGTTALQGRYVIAVCDTDPQAVFTQCAREHFGALTPLHIHPSPAQAIREVSAGTASVAVLPMPSETEGPREAWWTALMQKDEPRIHIIARLPFWARRPDGAPRAQALVVAASASDPSGDDRSLIGLELATDISRARLTSLLTAAGLAPAAIILRRDAGAPSALAMVDVAGLLDDDDPRLRALDPALRRPAVLGAYAVQVGGP